MMKSLGTLIVAASVGALLLAAPPAQTQNPRFLTPEDKLRWAFCDGKVEDAVAAVSEHYRIATEYDTARLMQSQQAPPEILFLDAIQELERVKRRLVAGEKTMSSYASLEAGMREINGLRAAEKDILARQGIIGPDPLLNCPCFSQLGGDLQFNVDALNRRIRELAAFYPKQRAAACESYKAKTMRTSDQSVPVKDAKVLLNQVEMPQPAGWTVTDGFMRVPGQGAVQVYWGEYEWSAIPDSIGPNGFEVKLNVRAHANPGQIFDTGIEISSPDGIYFQYVGNSTSKAQVTPRNGETLNNTTTVRVLFPPDAPSGREFTLQIGPFWALPVKYKFKVP